MTNLMNAALPATATLVPTSAGSSGLRAGLTDLDASRITAAIAAARTEATRTVYAQAWSQWERWCVTRGLPALPGDPLALCAYLTERAEAGRATGTLDMSCTAIRHVHRTCGLEDPVASEIVRQVRRGLMRTYGAAPRRLARPLTVDEIRQIVASIDRTTPIGLRDAAIILLGYASAMRRAEIVALTLADIEHKPAGLLITIRQSKTDQEGHGQVVAVAHGLHALTDPVAALALMAGGAGRDARHAVHTDLGQLRQPRTAFAACPSPHAPRPSPGSWTRRHKDHRTLPTGWPCHRGRDGMAYHSTGLRHRQDTRTSPSWSTATSGR